MIGWLIFAAYLVGYGYCVRTMARRMIDKDAREEVARRSDRPHYAKPDASPLVDTEDRILHVLIALVVSLFWPAVLIVLAVARGIRSPAEIAYAEKQELEVLRKQAKDLGLPMPEQTER